MLRVSIPPLSICETVERRYFNLILAIRQGLDTSLLSVPSFPWVLYGTRLRHHGCLPTMPFPNAHTHTHTHTHKTNTHTYTQHTHNTHTRTQTHTYTHNTLTHKHTHTHHTYTHAN